MSREKTIDLHRNKKHIIFNTETKHILFSHISFCILSKGIAPETRMHSSEMRTTRLKTVCHYALGRGVSAQDGVSAERGCLAGGCLAMGVSSQGICPVPVRGGGVANTPPPVDKQTPVKT